MKTAVLLGLLLFIGVADDSFITEYEYGKMLYNNPRGIGCDKCHGERGQGVIIANYYDGKKKKTLETKAIWAVSLKELTRALRVQDHRVMPKYYLTNGEINALYFYLSQERKREK